ncbi:MAG: hypothetical protein JW938_05920 [Candidatus Omnitrophica bacterium]|nr:hypothetical protein [Candidatus Omnitrophota bacterium]
MFGDFFVPSHLKLEQLNFRQLTDLIIETRKNRFAQRYSSAKSARARINEEAEAARIRHEQKKLDSIKEHKERIALSNRLAESVKQGNEFHEETLERIQKNLEQYYAQRKFKRNDQKREFKENDDVRREHQKKSEVYTDDKRAGKQQLVEDNKARRIERNALEKEYIDTTESQRTEHRTNTKGRKDKLKAAEEYRKAENKKTFENIDQTPVEPGVNKSKAFEDKAACVERARERTAANAESVGDPYEKNEEVMARKEKVLNDSRERKAPKDALFAENRKKIFERLKQRIDNAYEKGDIRREERAALVKKAQEHTAQLRESGITQRWRRYAIDTKWNAISPSDTISLKLFHFLNELWLEDQSPNRSEGTERGRSRANALEELYRMYTPLIDKEREVVDPSVRDLLEVAPPVPHAPNDEKSILQEPSESTLLFEKHIEDCIRKNIAYRDSLQKEDLIVYLDDMETRHPEQEAKEATDRSAPSSPFRNPNWVFKDVLTYIDDTEKVEAEKARDLEEQLNRKIEYNDEAKKDLLKRLNEDKQKRDDLMAEQRRAALRQYYAELIEDQNKSAHEKAVELGQFINLFF